MPSFGYHNNEINLDNEKGGRRILLEKDVKKLEEHIISLITQSNKYTVTQMILGNIPQSTVLNFKYLLKNNPLSINSDTLAKITKRLDELEGTSKYYNDTCNKIQVFVEKHILIGSISYLMKEMKLNYTTLKKITDYELTTPYRMITLKRYAEKVANKKAERN